MSVQSTNPFRTFLPELVNRILIEEVGEYLTLGIRTGEYRKLRLVDKFFNIVFRRLHRHIASLHAGFWMR